MKRHKYKALAIRLLFVAIKAFVCYPVLTSILVSTTANPTVRNDNDAPSDSSQTLVIMSNRLNVSRIYQSFNEFKTTFDVQVPTTKKLTFKNGGGE